MAGFLYKLNVGDDMLDYAGETEFHINDRDVEAKLRQAIADRFNHRVVTFQVDGDELDAVIWGIANYKKDQ